MTVEGEVLRSITIMGRSMLTLSDEVGAEIMVLGNGGAPAAGARVKVHGRGRHLAGFGKTIWMVIMADRIETSHDPRPTPDAPAEDESVEEAQDGEGELEVPENEGEEVAAD